MLTRVILIQYLFLLIIIAASGTGCKKDSLASNEGYEPRFIVEGWIENNDYPYIQITHNVPFFTSLDSAQLEELVIRWAKVTVSDGTDTEVLTAMRDKNYFPPFVYRGTALKGVAGKTYTLKIEYAGYTITSVTSIPDPVPLDSLWFIPVPGKDSLLQLNIRFKDNAAEKNFYRISTKTSGNKTFIPTLLSAQDDRYFNGKELTLQVNRGPESNLTVVNEPYFKPGDTVMVKFASIPESGYDFWSSFRDEVMNASNPLIGSTGIIKSNIEGQAKGIWCGYGSVVYRVIAGEGPER